MSSINCGNIIRASSNGILLGSDLSDKKSLFDLAVNSDNYEPIFLADTYTGSISFVLTSFLNDVKAKKLTVKKSLSLVDINFDLQVDFFIFDMRTITIEAEIISFFEKISNFILSNGEKKIPKFICVFAFLTGPILTGLVEFFPEYEIYFSDRFTFDEIVEIFSDHFSQEERETLANKILDYVGGDHVATLYIKKIVTLKKIKKIDNLLPFEFANTGVGFLQRFTSTLYKSRIEKLEILAMGHYVSGGENKTINSALCWLYYSHCIIPVVDTYKYKIASTLIETVLRKYLLGAADR